MEPAQSFVPYEDNRNPLPLLLPSAVLLPVDVAGYVYEHNVRRCMSGVAPLIPRLPLLALPMNRRIPPPPSAHPQIHGLNVRRPTPYPRRPGGLAPYSPAVAASAAAWVQRCIFRPGRAPHPPFAGSSPWQEPAFLTLYRPAVHSLTQVVVRPPSRLWFDCPAPRASLSKPDAREGRGLVILLLYPPSRS